MFSVVFSNFQIRSILKTLKTSFLRFYFALYFILPTFQYNYKFLHFHNTSTSHYLRSRSSETGLCLSLSTLSQSLIDWTPFWSNEREKSHFEQNCRLVRVKRLWALLSFEFVSLNLIWKQTQLKGNAVKAA